MKKPEYDLNDWPHKTDKWMPPKPEHYPWDGVTGFTVSEFDTWYDKEIRPLFENAVVVYGQYEPICDENEVLKSKWFDWENGEPYIEDGLGDTHKALLINIHPIKEESAEDLLRELVNATEAAGIIEYKGISAPLRPCVQRAKAYLEGKK